MKKLTRREFIKLSGTVAAAGLLAGNSGCAAPKPKPSREDVLKFYPDAPTSKVVRAAHPGAWEGEDLVPDILRQMLDASIVQLTGLKKARDAWSILFSADEKVAIKTNSIRGGATHPELVMALTECLQDAGVPAEQIFIFDRNTSELESEGYPVNVDGPGVRCYGNGENWGDPGNYTAGWTLLNQQIKLSDILLSCDALINVPILKRGGPGISFAMKNHYGTFDIPASFHGTRFERGIPELNALPPIKDRTRLTIGDALATSAYDGFLDNYEVMAIGNTILMSFDPVAFDAIGVQMVVDKLTADGRESYARTTPLGAESWLAVGAEIGLGTNDPANIELVGVHLG
jgi:uncharacterized protein (DUF362 family)